MRISDWSSDVCSSDLRPHSRDTTCRSVRFHFRGPDRRNANESRDAGNEGDGHRPVRRAGCATRIGIACNYAPPGDCCHAGWVGRRSEEHTSELQSLMRISYAVFCLTTKMTKVSTQNHHIRSILTNLASHT